MAEAFALVGVGYVKLNDGLLEYIERIKNSHRCVSECGWINDDSGGTIDSFVDLFNDFIFFVGLMELDFQAVHVAAGIPAAAPTQTSRLPSLSRQQSRRFSRRTQPTLDVSASCTDNQGLGFDSALWQNEPEDAGAASMHWVAPWS